MNISSDSCCSREISLKVKVMISVNVEVYSLVCRSANHPILHNYTPITGPVHSFSHLNFPGSAQPCCHYGAGNYLITRELLQTYQVPTYSWVERVHVWVKALPRSTAPQQIQASRHLDPAISRLQVAHATTDHDAPVSIIGSCNAKSISTGLLILRCSSKFLGVIF